MKKNLIPLLLVFLIMGCTAQETNTSLPIVSSGTIERVENFPSKFISQRNVDVWLPDGYNSNEQYSVLYMHDGQMLFDSTNTWNNQEWGVDEIVSKLIKEGVIKKCIVVGIWNSGRGRHSDYFPQKPFEALPKKYQDSVLNAAKRNKETALFSTEVQSDNYLKFLVSELKPFIDKTYSTKPDKENTFIAGSSMGGLVSAYAICEYPEIFGGAACMSTHWIGTFSIINNPIPETFINYLNANLPSSETHKIYFDYGTEFLDALYEPYQKRVDEIMINSGYDEKNWKTMKFTGADHSEKSWRNRLDIPIIFLLGNI